MLTVQYAVGSNETAYKELINHISLIKAGPHTPTHTTKNVKKVKRTILLTCWQSECFKPAKCLDYNNNNNNKSIDDKLHVLHTSTQMMELACFAKLVFLSFKHFKCLKWMLQSYFKKVNKLSEWCQCCGENGSYITQTRAQNTSDEDGQKPNPNQSTRTYVTTRIDGVLNTRTQTERERNRDRDREKH